ncbi:MAG: transcriptional regulator [Acidimicrobiales bacterium]|nr:MAG: transcriptional regulator [Acidimicrobiales bacterium]
MKATKSRSSAPPRTKAATARDDIGAEERCCPPLGSPSFGPEEAVRAAAGFSALADPVRLYLFSLLAASGTGGACVCALVDAVDRSQPTVSHHLRVLVDAGLLRMERRGRWSWYTVVPEKVDELRSALTID